MLGGWIENGRIFLLSGIADYGEWMKKKFLRQYRKIFLSFAYAREAKRICLWNVISASTARSRFHLYHIRNDSNAFHSLKVADAGERKVY